jgi:hypothetical protein
MLSNLFFMHLMAVYRPVLTLCALNTSENVPSPCREMSRYFCMLPQRATCCGRVGPHYLSGAV